MPRQLAAPKLSSPRAVATGTRARAPTRRSAASNRATANSRPGAADVARHLAVIVHDLRGPATALQAYARFLDEQARPELDPTAASWLDAFQANAELTGHLCEALSILDGTSLRSGASLQEIVLQASTRLQKILARARFVLKVPGDFPDRRSERRCLGFVVEALLVAAAEETGTGGPSGLEWCAVEREERIVLILGFEPGPLEGLSALPARLESGQPRGLSELALSAALSDLGAVLRCPAPGRLEVSLPIGSEVTWP